jgi:cell division protein FtsW (lipid II flippase)
MMQEDENINTFLDVVCSQVKARVMHREIRKEIGNHLEELIARKEMEGYTPKAAALWAIQQMGDPAVLGRGLHQVHKPRIPWGLIMTVLFFSIMSLFAMWAVDRGYQGTAMSAVHFTKHQFIFVIVGIVLMLSLYFCDIRKLRDYSWLLYFITVGGMVVTALFGVYIYGSRHYLTIGPTQVDWIGTSLYLLVIAMTGILMNSSLQKTDHRKHNQTLKFLLVLGVPGFIYMEVHAIPELVMFVMVSLVLFGWLTQKWLWSAIIALVLFLISIVYVYINPYLWYRLIAVINPYTDPTNSGYMYIKMIDVIRSAGWGGHGFGADRLPLIHSEMLLTYLIKCFGWGAGIILLIAVMWFLTRLAHGVKAVREPYGRTLFLVLAMMLAFPLVYGLAMTTGLVPLVDLPFPFLSYGGSHLLLEYAIVGLLLGVYRRKDMIPFNSR